MLKTKILQRLLFLLLLMTVGVEDAWAINRTISFDNKKRISNNGAGLFTSADNAGNEYALALADFSNLPGINTAGTITIQFDSNIPSGSRWLIGTGDKEVRGTNANGSNKATYNTDGLLFRFGTNDGTNYRIDGASTSTNNNAFGVTVHATITFDRIACTYSYTLKNGGTTLLEASGVATTVKNATLIEVYTWANTTSITLSNVTVQYEDLYFENAEDVVYIEDIEYNKLTNSTGNTASATYSANGYFRLGGNNLYPIKTTGDEADNTTEGEPITVTVTAGTAKAISKLRIKTRNELDPTTMYTSLSNTFDIGSTVGKFTSQVVTMDGMTLYLSYYDHTPVVRAINGDYGIAIIDGNGYAFGNYANGHEWGTVYKIITTQAKNLTVSGYFSTNGAAAAQLYDDSHNVISGKTIANPGNGSLATATFALDAGHTYYLHQSSGYDYFCLKSLSYRDAYFDQTYAITTTGSTYTQTVQNMESPVYSIVGREGDIASTGVTINSSTGQVSGITAGGALKIQATGGGKTCFYYLTVAYPATPYPGKLWEFNQWYDTYQPPLSIDEAGKLGFPRIDANSDGSVVMTDGDPSTITDEHGDEWVAELKNINYGASRPAP